MYLGAKVIAESFQLQTMISAIMKSFALGRKNWLFADTPKGADASAIIYNLLVTPKMNKLNPYEYLRNV